MNMMSAIVAFVRVAIPCLLACIGIGTGKASAQTCNPAVTASFESVSRGTSHFDGSRFALATTANGVGSVSLYDISDPSQPDVIANFPVPGWLTSFPRMELRGDVLWLFDGPNDETVPVDISDPAAPVFGLAAGSSPAYATVSGSMLFAARYGQNPFFQTTIYDVSDPMAPQAITTFQPHQGDQGNIIAVGSTLYAMVQAFDSRLFIWDVSDPASPTLISETVFEGYELVVRWGAPGLLLTGGFTNDGSTALGTVLIDVSDPAAPTILSEVPERGTAVAADGRLSISTYNGMYPALAVYDISDPTVPARVFLGRFDAATPPPNSQTDVQREPAAVSSRVIVFRAGGFAFFGVPSLIEVCDLACQAPLSDINRVVLQGPTTVEPGDTTIQGVPLAQAQILVGGPGLEISPGFVLPPSASVSLTINGTHTIGSLEASLGGHVEVNGSTTASAFVLDAATATVNGDIVTGSLSLTNGSTILDGGNTP